MIEFTLLFMVGGAVAVLLVGALLVGMFKLLFGLVLIPFKIAGFLFSLMFAVVAGVFLLFLLPIGLVVLVPLLVFAVPLALVGGAVALVCHAI